MRYIIIYLCTLVVLIPIDFAFLGTVGKKLYASSVGDMILQTPRLPPAIMFYALYLAGVVIFVNGSAPANWQFNLLYGALFGLFCYSTFALTNMALLKHWEWSVVITDTLWGAAVTAIAASVGGLLANWIMSRI